jgi:hypothetical protein
MELSNTHQKPLEEIIYRGLKTLQKRETDLDPELSKDILNLAKQNPTTVLEYINQGLELSNENGKESNHTIHYMINALKIVELHPDRLQKYYELSKEYIKKTGKWNNAFIIHAPKIIIESPDNIEQYFQLGQELINLQTDELKSISETFFEHGVNIAIKKPSKLKKYVKHIKDIHEIDQNNISFIIDAPEVLLNYPKHFKEYSKTFTQLMREEKKRAKITGVNTDCSGWYLAFAKEIIKTDAEKIKLFSRKGLELLKDRYLSPAIAEGFIIGGKDIVLNCPENLEKYIQNGIKIEKEIYRSDFQSIVPYFLAAKNILIKDPKKLKIYVQNAFKIFNIPNLKGDNIKLVKSYISSGNHVLLNHPKEYNNYLSYAKNLAKLDSKLGEKFLSLVRPEIISDTKIYQNFYQIALNLAKQSIISAENYLTYFNQSDDQIKDPNINRLYDLISNKITPFLKSYSREIRLDKLESQHNNIHLHEYYKTTALLKTVWKRELTPEEKNSIKDFSPQFIKDLNEHKFLGDKNSCPNIFKLKSKEKFFPTLEELSKKDLWTSEKDKSFDSKIFIQNILEELSDYFSRSKMSEEFLYEINTLYEHFAHNTIRANKIKIEVNENRLDDFFSARKDCISVGGKYASEFQNFISNSYTTTISINAYDEGVAYKKIYSKENLGKVIACVAEIDKKKALYVAGVSMDSKISQIPNWKDETYRLILDLAKLNKDKIEGVFFDLNPRSISKMSHRWAEYLATQLELEKNKDYTYTQKNMSTENFQTHRKQRRFEMNNPKWNEIRILRDEEVTGAFFIESIMQKPENKGVGNGIKPDLVYDKGYVVGKYIKTND